MAGAEKSIEGTKAKSNDIGSLLRITKRDLERLAMDRVNKGGTASSSLITTGHPMAYLAVESAKELLNIARELSKRKGKTDGVQEV